VEQLTESVAANSDKHIPITVHLIDSDKVSGFVLPGGHIYIYRGLLLRLQNEAELASLLARGIAHTAVRSQTKITTKSQVMQIGAISTELLGPFGATDYGTDVGSIVAIYQGSGLEIPLTLLKFRRDAESAADYFALQYVYKSGYDPQCFLDFVQRIWGPDLVPQKTPAPPEAFSTYPPLPKRLQALQNETAQILPPRDTAVVSTSAFQEFQDHLQPLLLGQRRNRTCATVSSRFPRLVASSTSHESPVTSHFFCDLHYTASSALNLKWIL
jgi:predicted Zn-dependent protease